MAIHTSPRGSAESRSGSLERFSASDRRLILLAVLVTGAALWVASHYFHRAFPEASIQFQVSAATSEPVAQQFLRARGLETAGYLHASEFAYDDEAKTFLERELGLDRTEKLLRTRVRLWRWEQRWFRPLSKEEFDVAVATSGEVVGFNHPIADEAPGANLAEADARERAVTFLVEVMQLDPSKLQPVGVDREQRAHRTDYTFTWKDREPLAPGAQGDLAEAEYRHVVRMQGAEVGQYREYLRVPDQWSRDFARLRSKNETAGAVDSGLLLAVFVAMLIVLAMRVRRADIRWRPALWIGAAGAVLSFLAAMNGLSQDFFNYDTTQSYAGFVSGDVFSALLSALGVGMLLLALTATAESLYRERFGEQIALEGWMRRRGLRSKGFCLSLILGLALAAFFFAYQAIFYMIANHFGAWAPADVPYDDLLNTRLPWAFVLFGGFFPAISEEFGFRMLAIPLFEKWWAALARGMGFGGARLGWATLWPAVIAASFLWGFGHATYPNEPFWIRGVEVGLGGILLSWMMIRFGILTTVVWHYTVDALYTAMLLLRAHDAYLRFSGGLTALIAAIPLLIALAAYWRRGGFERAGELTNRALGSAEEPAEAPASAREEAEEEGPAETPYEAVPGPAWTLGLVVAVALLSAFAVPLLSWSSALPWRKAPREAVAEARAFLIGQGFAVEGYKAGVTAATADSLANGLGDQNMVAAADIFSQQGRRAMLAAFSGAGTPELGAYYRVRFYKPLQEEEFTVAVRPGEGKVIGFAHSLPDAAPGGAPTLDHAEAVASAFLAGQGIETGNMELRTATQERRPARTDSDLVWEQAAPSPLPGEVAYRVEVELDGDRVAVMHGWYHVPEARVREFERETLATTLWTALRLLLIAALAALVLWHILAFVRTHLPWRPLFWAAGAGALISGLVAVNALPATAAAGYDTSQPWSSFAVNAVIGVAVAALFGLLATLALLAPLALTAPRAWTLITDPRSRDAWETAWAWDALWVGVLAVGWALGWSRVQEVVAAHWHRAAQAPMASPPEGLGNWWPGGSALLSAPLHALWFAAILALVAPVLFRGWELGGARRLTALGGWVLLAAGLAANAPAHTLPQYGFNAALAGLSVLLLFGFTHLFLRDNPLSYLSAVLLPMLALGAAEWWDMDFAAAHATAALFAAMAAVWVGWLGWHARHGRR